MDADVHDGGDYQWCIFDDENDEDEVDMMLGWKIWMHMLRTFSLQFLSVIISVINCVFGDLFVPVFHFNIKVMDILLHLYQRDLKQNCGHNQPEFRAKSPKTAITNTWAFLKAMFLTDVSYYSSECFIFPEMEQDACLGWILMFFDMAVAWGAGTQEELLHARLRAKHLSLKVFSTMVAHKLVSKSTTICFLLSRLMLTDCLGTRALGSLVARIARPASLAICIAGARTASKQ